jgi:long-subunit acyl-CoA synthetase (AMP-forming)
MIADMAILMVGGVFVPRGSDSTSKEIEFIVEHIATDWISSRDVSKQQIFNH